MRRQVAPDEDHESETREEHVRRDGPGPHASIDLEKVLALLEIYASIRPTQLKRSVEFLEAKASRMLNV